MEFSDSKVSSKVVGVKGKSRHMMNPEWHYELWTPVTVPTATSRIKHSVWDYDTVGSHDLAGIFYVSPAERNDPSLLPVYLSHPLSATAC